MLPDSTPPDALNPPPPEPAIANSDTSWRSFGEVLLCSGYPSQLLLGALLQAAGLLPRMPDGSLSATFVFALSLLDTVLLLGLIVWLIRLRGERPSAIFLGQRAIIPEAIVGMFSLPIVLTVVILV